MKDCVFCQIVRGEIPADFVYQDKNIAVFANIAPKAPTHLIIIPKSHIEQLKDLSDKIFLEIKNKILEIVDEKDLSRKGYRIVTNGGAAKAVSHLHFHLLGDIKAEREV